MTTTCTAVSLFAILLCADPGWAQLLPKMLSSPVTAGKRLGPPSSQGIRLSSNYSISMGYCSPDTPFQLSLYGPGGRGAIGIEGPAQSKGIFVEAPTDGTVITVAETAQPNFFAVEHTPQDDFEGLPFEYSLSQAALAGNDGVPVQVHCGAETSVLVIINDNVDFTIEADVREFQDGAEIGLLDGTESVTPLIGYTRPSKGQSASPLIFSSATTKKVGISRQPGCVDNGLALIDGIFTSSSGHKVRRSFVHESKSKPANFKTPKKVTVNCCEINGDGDISVRFPGLTRQDEYLRVDARFGITLDSQPNSTVEIVDVTAMLTSGGYITVHGGWIRKALQELQLLNVKALQDLQLLKGNRDGWDVILTDVVVSDPDNDYRVVGIKGTLINNGLPPGLENRAIFARGATADEMGISEEMKRGRKPSTELRRRELSGNHKKILVHGYCASQNPFTESHFTNYVKFSHPNTPTSWSHNTFAVNIANFATSQNLHGCGCIAHSQGGAACLHLYTYYWSCLDNASSGGSRLIQSVGTPYQGTSLAGNLAVLGEIFGVGCGSNSDLTYSGAASWLSNIPSWARSKVRYYTTSFKDNWWSYDYCHVGSDLLLSDPDDGTTEKYAGQLPGATNGGHKSGWCHVAGMQDPPQTTDSSRNSDMNSNAKY